jgi:hypothetical protein
MLQDSMLMLMGWLVLTTVRLMHKDWTWSTHMWHSVVQPYLGLLCKGCSGRQDDAVLDQANADYPRRAQLLRGSSELIGLQAQHPHVNPINKRVTIRPLCKPNSLCSQFTAPSCFGNQQEHLEASLPVFVISTPP